MCSEGKYIVAMAARMEDCASATDCSAMNSVKIKCLSLDWTGEEDLTPSFEGYWGEWSEFSPLKRDHFVYGATLKS